MLSSQLVRIIDAAKRATGNADPDILFYDYDRREPIYLDKTVRDCTFHCQPEERIDRRIRPDGKVSISLTEETP